MTKIGQAKMQRRRFIKEVAALAGAAATATMLPARAADTGKLKVGLMLPYTGTYAVLGVAITNGFKLAVSEAGGKLGGREVEYFTVDDESDPAKAPENTLKLVHRDKVDVLVGTVHSGVAAAMVKVARDNGTLLVIPNAGLAAATGALCAPNIFRTSFTNWQPAYPMGKIAYDKGHRNVVTLTWKYAAGEESVDGFKEAFEKAGGKVMKSMFLDFPGVEFQSYLTEIAGMKPDAVFVFFSGGGAVKFVKDYAAAGLKDRIPLYSPGFLTDGLLDAMGDSAQGLLTTLHYGDGIDTTRNKEFRLAYAKTYKLQPDVFAVQGYDAGLLLAAGLKAAKGDVSQKALLIDAMEKANIDSPRGKWTMSKSHNPIQDIYLRQVVGKENKVIGVAWKALADPARGCKMGS